MAQKKTAGVTPLMQQYFSIKEQYDNTLLLFQVGDFYELFFDDARQAAQFLGIALTKRGNHNGTPIPLCGVPLHAVDHYLTKLVRGGFRVALCDQLEEAQPGKVVQRGVTRVLTPGTLTDDTLLDGKRASYLFSFFPHNDTWALLFGELLTAQLFATVIPKNEHKLLESELARFMPDELLIPSIAQMQQYISLFKTIGYGTTIGTCAPTKSEHNIFQQKIAAQFGNTTAQKLQQHTALEYALHTLYAYLHKNQHGTEQLFKHISLYDPEDFLLLDPATQKNLELIKNNQDGSDKYTLFSALDRAATKMGSRMIKKWIARPLIKREAIQQRLSVVAHFTQHMHSGIHIAQQLTQVGDLERIVGRIALGRSHLHDYVALKNGIAILPAIREQLTKITDNSLIQAIVQNIQDFSALEKLLSSALNDDSSKEWTIKPGFDKQLDELRALLHDADAQVLALEHREQKETGIQSLKVRYNNVHGYYIEVTKANLRAVPDHYIRQQTLVGRERFTTPELQTLQHKLTQARSEITHVEKQIFERVQKDVSSYTTVLRKAAHMCAHIDALIGLARCAYDNEYVCPEITQEQDIIISNGRHPVIEQSVSGQFIPNDTQLTDTHSVWIVTGPNMGGKSTYLRQVAQICVMAHVGSFVPAQRAQIPILDRIFTRIGSGDNLADGKSTFLVEMEETAAICSYATQNSLVILDEVGRGTSTFDGLAIAQSVVEHIYKTIQARCLFATHYHELTHLSEQFPGIASYYAASKKTTDGILFLYKIMQGIADGSFGIEVAKLAHLPETVVQRAQSILTTLADTEQRHTQALKENNQTVSSNLSNAATVENDRLQKQLITLHSKIDTLQRQLKTVHDIDYDELSPKKAFDILWQIKKI